MDSAVRLASVVAIVLVAAGPSASAQQPTLQGAREMTLACPIAVGSSSPRLAVESFAAEPTDAETRGVAVVVADALWHDLAFEREFVMLPLGVTPVDRSAADLVLAGTVRRSEAGVVVDTRLTEVATGRVLFSKTYTGADIPRRSADTKTVQTFASGVR